MGVFESLDDLLVYPCQKVCGLNYFQIFDTSQCIVICMTNMKRRGSQHTFYVVHSQPIHVPQCNHLVMAVVRA